MASEKRYENMIYRRCGNSGLKLPLISVGLWQNFGSVDPFEKSKEMILTSFDNGITHFDLANNYGPIPGSAEDTFGKVLKNQLKNYRDELIISTKAGYTMWEGPYGDWGSKKYLVASLDQSLKRMGLDYVDIFYHHRPDPNTPIEETVEALEFIVKSGKALYVAISNYNEIQSEEIYNQLKLKGIHCLCNQVRYSMIDKTMEKAIEKAGELNMGTTIFSPLAQGILSGKYINGIPNDSRAASLSVFLNEKDITGDIVSITKELKTIADNRNQTMSQMALAWVLNNKNVSTVLVGVSKTVQLLDNIGTIKNLDFSDEEILKINKIVN